MWLRQRLIKCQIMEQREIELELLVKRRPNIYGNSFFIAFTKLVLWLLAVGFLLAGIRFTAGGFLEQLRGVSIESNAYKHQLHFIIASCCYLLSSVFFIAVWFSRMVIRRNVFIMELHEWHKKYYSKKKEEGTASNNSK